MKRYMLFMGENDSSLGGMNDFEESFESIEEAINYIKGKQVITWKHMYIWVHVYDSATGLVVYNDNFLHGLKE